MSDPRTPQWQAADDARIEWFRRDKFGLFIHWGLYSVAAGRWRGEPSPGGSEWLMHRMRVPAVEYAGLASQFDPQRFDPEGWAQLALDAGMKYVVFTAKHHDGFSMYDTAHPYNVVADTPFGRDPIPALAEACARRGLRFGLYYSQAQDWFEPGGAGNDWDYPPNEVKDRDGAFDAYLRGKVEPQLEELLTRYGPICLIWFDTAQKMMAGERARRLSRLVRSLQPDCLINHRLVGLADAPDHDVDYQAMSDNVKPPRVQTDPPWEVPAYQNRSWGYRADDHNWRSPGELVRELLDVVSKGGNLLLNVGPTADGDIPGPSADNLRVVGRWLEINGDAIYGADPSPFGEEFGEYSTTLVDRRGDPIFLDHNAWRCTTKPGRLYFTLFKIEADGQRGVFVLPGFRNRITSVYALDDPARSPLEVTLLPDGRRSISPSRFRKPYQSLGAVYVVEFEGDRIEW